jgi:SAM-dependent methyltransferase
MSRKNKPAVQRYHDRVARRYDASYDDVYWRFHDALTWDYLKPHLPADLSMPVLDLGCGTGKWALKLLASGYRVACVDISGAMIGKAKLAVEEQGRSERAEFFQADLCDLGELLDERYSFAVAMGDPIGCASKPGRALKEIKKKLLPGSILIATLDNKLGALDYYLKEGSAKQMADFLKTGKTHWLTKEKEEQFDIHTFTPREAKALFETAGYDVLEIRGKTVLNFNQRTYRGLLADPENKLEWMRIEKKLSRDADAVARASHLQIVAKTPSR